MTVEDANSSVSDWIASLVEDSDVDGAAKLWRRYYGELIKLAQALLSRHNAGTLVDGEDIAQMVFANVFEKLCNGHYPKLDRNGLWGLLVVAAENRVIDEVRRQSASKRPPEARRLKDDSTNPSLEQWAKSTESISSAKKLVDVVREFFGNLPDELVEIARHRMEGRTTTEIAELTGVSRATIDRKIEVLRSHLRRIFDL